MKRFLLSLALGCLIAAPLWSDVPSTQPATATEARVTEELGQDVLLRALVDELNRNREKLRLEGLEDPYHLQYRLDDSAQVYAVASLGAIVGSNASRSRALTTQVRVGSYELDNTNYRDDGYYRAGRDAAVPLENDYAVVRQAIWWATDRNYKDVLEVFAQKQAFMKTKVIEDKPNDFSPAPAAVHFEPPADPPAAVSELEKIVRDVSAVFRDYPDVQASQAWVQVDGGTQYLVNSEGTRIRTAGRVYTCNVYAVVQAEDGMPLADVLTVHARRLEELPPVDELIRRSRQMTDRLLAVRSAPKLDSYTGPVLFEAEAAAELFAERFAGNFAGGQRPVGSRTPPDDFSRKLNRRVLPRFLSVMDDPTVETLHGEPVLGHYTYDDEGVKARSVSLVEDGRLKALLMSRNPSREFAESTGHGRGGRATVGCLIVTADDPADPESLRKELIEAAEDEGLEYAIRIEATGAAGLRAPLVVYKVYPDGREELVRGVEIGQFDLKAFKRMLAAGNQPYVLNNSGGSGRTIVVPALLFEELDLAKIDRDFDTPRVCRPHSLRSKRTEGLARLKRDWAGGLGRHCPRVHPVGIRGGPENLQGVTGRHQTLRQANRQIRHAPIRHQQSAVQADEQFHQRGHAVRPQDGVALEIGRRIGRFQTDELRPRGRGASVKRRVKRRIIRNDVRKKPVILPGVVPLIRERPAGRGKPAEVPPGEGRVP